MLVISRRKGQRVTIGDDIELVITEVHRSHVKVGITAPRGLSVLRGEVFDSIEAANRAAAESELDADFGVPAQPEPAPTVKAQDRQLALRQAAGSASGEEPRRGTSAERPDPRVGDESAPA
jgi:carbon storage regulator